MEHPANEYIANKSCKVTRTKLEAWCRKHGYPLPSYEAYGRKVCAYWFKAPEGWNRARWESELRRVGCKVNPDWNTHDGFNGTEVHNISYFKAPGWDE